MLEQNKALARSVYEMITTGDFDRVQEVIDPAAADNEYPPGAEHSRARLIETFKQFVSEAREAFPDMRITVEDMIAEGDRVAARVTMRGTHLGEFEGIAPTGKRVQMSAIDIFRFADGKIVEHWGHADDLTSVLRPREQT